ncbi:MAG: AAA family ATPase [Chloroflexi bacterium]|nr:MAG: AAA family ATPase [Chloroflexota bacterium]
MAENWKETAVRAAKLPSRKNQQRRNDIIARRNHPARRFFRFLRRFWFWGLLIALGYAAYSDPEILNLVLIALGFIFRLVFAIVFVIIQFGAIFWFMSQTKIEIIRPGDPKTVTFEDYKGQDRLVEMVKQWLSLLYDRTEFQKMGGRFINGLLLYGPPGTGKTLLAKCMAGEAGVAFISVEGSGFRGMFWGMDVLRMMSFIRKARKLAREYGACIAFIDEIDAVGTSRGAVMGGQGGQVGMRGGMPFFGGTGALTRLLYEMDGVEEKTRMERWQARIYKLLGKTPPPRNWHVLFMGSTNRPDVLDPALTRPGRFDRIIEVSPPDKTGRREIIKYYLSKIRHDDTVDLEAIVEDTAWATPAKIMAAITKDAVRLALFDGRDKVSQRDIDQAFQEQAFGLERPIEEMQEDQRRQIAYHEAGHAVASHYYRPEKRIVRATIIGRGGGTLGYVQATPKYEEYAKPLRKIVADIMVSLAGHVATKVFLGEYWTGAYSDFANVRSHIAHLASLGYFGPPLKDPMAMMNGSDPHSREIEWFWNSLQEQCEVFIRTHAAEVDAVARALLERESLTGKEVLEVMAQARQTQLGENGAVVEMLPSDEGSDGEENGRSTSELSPKPQAEPSPLATQPPENEEPTS